MTQQPSGREQQLAAARSLAQRGQFREAETLFLALLHAHKDDREVLEGLASLHVLTGRQLEASRVLETLIAAYPDVMDYYFQLAGLLDGQGKLQEAVACYRKLVARMPALAVARFNLASYLKRTAHLDEALLEYQQALDLAIDQPEEALSNMAVIHTQLRQDGKAEAALHEALRRNPDYIPALYNLALLREEFGEKAAALELFGKILDLDPTYFGALVRIAQARSVSDPGDPLVRKLRRALRRSNIDTMTRESLHFALGKVLDECRLYDEAFAHFRQGNECSAARVERYDKDEHETRFAGIAGTFTRSWLDSVEPVSDRPLVFLCGMFRSGSTLFEQVLAAHPQVTAGGEMDYFNEQLRQFARSPAAVVAAPGADECRRLGSGYLEYLDRTFPGAAIVTNKRPDNFVYLGLLKALYPNVRFVHTVRHPLDTCLSVYVQQLGEDIAYANDLDNAAHYYQQYRQLMAHWTQLFGASIFDAVYDDFVADPQGVTRALLEFLDLEWNEACLAFQQAGNRVRTASVWQVRQPLYRGSSGRWRNYEQQLAAVSGLRGLMSEGSSTGA